MCCVSRFSSEFFATSTKTGMVSWTTKRFACSVWLFLVGCTDSDASARSQFCVCLHLLLPTEWAAKQQLILACFPNRRVVCTLVLWTLFVKLLISVDPYECLVRLATNTVTVRKSASCCSRRCVVAFSAITTCSNDEGRSPFTVLHCELLYFIFNHSLSLMIGVCRSNANSRQFRHLSQRGLANATRNETVTNKLAQHNARLRRRHGLCRNRYHRVRSLPRWLIRSSLCRNVTVCWRIPLIALSFQHQLRLNLRSRVSSFLLLIVFHVIHFTRRQASGRTCSRRNSATPTRSFTSTSPKQVLLRLLPRTHIL